jgi:adenine phosphoribosyltransferase
MPNQADIQFILDTMREVQDFPIPGVLFRDLTTVLAHPDGLAATTRALGDPWVGQVDAVAGMEARGFLLGAPVAHKLGVGFICIRKPGKLPPPVEGRDYALEYGVARLEMAPHTIQPGQRVLIIDDVLATGGTASAACELVESAGGIVVAVQIVIELLELNGRARLPGRRVESLIAE